MPMLSKSLVYRQQVCWQRRMKSNCSLNLWGCNSKPVPSEIHLAERKNIQIYSILPLPYMLRYLGKSFSHSTAEVCEALHKKWRWQKQPWAGQFPVSPRPTAIFIALGQNKRFMDNESTVRQEYAKDETITTIIWDIIYNLANGTRVVRTRWRSTASSSTSPSPVLWYIVRNSSHPQTSALEDKSGKQNHLRAQDVLPVHPVKSRSYHLIQVIVNLQDSYGRNVQAVWLTQGSFIHQWRELTPWAFRCI